MMSTNEYIICTVIAKNYLSFARTLYHSFLQHHPNGKCYVLIIDDFKDHISQEKEPFTIISIADLHIPNWTEFSFKYNILELSTAVKPYLISYLFDVHHVNRILYLDPDILITHRLNSLYNELDTHDIILTPHLDTDYPDDGCLPNDAHIMRSGIFNLGFIGMKKSDNVIQFLSWWQHKLYDKCIGDQKTGYFVDQKFIDLAITLFSNIKIIRDRGYNVAYWNIHSRTITHADNTWMCNDGPLFFYHFSNYRLERPADISGHQNRFKLSDMPGLRQLYDLYREILIQNGYWDTKDWPYTYNYFHNGKRIRNSFRRHYRSFRQRVMLENPFNSYYRFLFLLSKHYYFEKIKRKLRKALNRLF